MPIIDKVQVGQTVYDLRDTHIAGEIIAPPYSSNNTYAVGDACSYEGLGYKCTVPITTPEPWDSNHWSVAYALTEVTGKADKQDTVLTTTLSRGRKGSTTIGTGSFAFGDTNEANASYSFAIGSNTKASGVASVSCGAYTKATASYAFAQGNSTEANADCSFAEGTGTRAFGKNMHALGKYNTYDLVANWDEWVSETSYAVGDKVKITNGSTVTGHICIEANSDVDFDDTKWEDADTDIYALIIGNGTSDNARSNALVIAWDGTARYGGDIYVGCNANSSGGNKLATEAYSDLGDVITPSSTIPIPSANSSVTYDMAGITDAHTLLLWRFSSSAENAPPVSLSYTTYNDYFTITNTSGYAPNETIKPVFVRMKGKTATQHV